MRILPGKGWPPAGSESCASPAVTQAAKRRQRLWELCDRASKGRESIGPSCFRRAAAAFLRCNGLAHGTSPGSTSRASTHGGTPRNLGGPDVSVSKKQRFLGSARKVLACERNCPSLSRERSDGAGHGTAKRRKRSAAGWTSGSRSASIRPVKAGNRSAGPAGGKGGVGTWTHWGGR